MLSPKTDNPTDDGMVSKKIMPSERASVCRNSSRLPAAALRDTEGKVAEAMATPKSPSGSCIKRNA